MSRFVVPRPKGAVLASTGPGKPDDLTGRLVKYVPAEILAIFTSFIAAAIGLKLLPPDAQRFTAGAIGVFTVGTFAYIWVKAPAGQVRNAHLVVSPIAFVAWAYPISSSLLGSWFIGWWSLAAQALVVLLAAIIIPTGTPPQAAPVPVKPAP